MTFYKLLQLFVINDNDRYIAYDKQYVYLNPQDIEFYYYNNNIIDAHPSVTLNLVSGETIIVDKLDFKKMNLEEVDEI